MTALYNVQIVIGDDDVYGLVEWDLDHSPPTPSGPAKITDGVHVLAGLQFGWSTPDDALYPLQPNPMVASFALNLPDFVAEPWMVEGAPVAITVRVLDEIKFVYGGRLTDATAVPRNHRTGVTLSIAAVDYTVDPGEWTEDVAISTGGYDATLLGNLWSVTDLGDFPDFPTDPSLVLVPNVGDVRGTIDQVLLTTPSVLDTPAAWGPPQPKLARTIFAPVLNSMTGRPPTTGPRWAFDPVWQSNLAPDLTIDAARLDRLALTWARNKRTPPSILNVVGAADEDTPPSASGPNPFGGARPWGPEVVAKLDTVTRDQDRVELIRDFYVPSSQVRGWTVTNAKWLLTKARVDTGDVEDDDAALLAEIPDTLMPRWDLPEGDPGRAEYCQRLVELVNVRDDLNPYADDDDPTLVAPIRGVTLTIQGAQVTLDIALRHLQGDPS